MVILYFLRWFNIILFLRFLFQPGRLCTKLGFFVYYYLPYCYLHQTQDSRKRKCKIYLIKEGKIILKIALRLWSYVLDFLFSNPIVWSYIFRRISSPLWLGLGWLAGSAFQAFQAFQHSSIFQATLETRDIPCQYLWQGKVAKLIPGIQHSYCIFIIHLEIWKYL